jgi:2-methylisocitrate lyase-like PEP mutase family enzyme
MTDQTVKARLFRDLHVKGAPLVLVNAWDAGSAKAVAEAGARAIATGSWSVAAAHGASDGEALPLDLALANLARIAAATDLPVTVDLEAGYGADAGAVGATVARALAAGAVGLNIEDGVPPEGALREAGEQAERLTAARAACERAGMPAFINARTDVFFQKPADRHDADMAQAALERARLYADAGADGLFVPGLIDEALIGRIAELSPLPVNLMATPASPPLARLAALGVARVSHGPFPYIDAMKALTEAARRAMG